MKLDPITLQGALIVLEPLAASHAPALAEVGLVPNLWSLQPRLITTAAEMQQYVEVALDEQAIGASLPFVVFHQPTRTIVGSTRFMDIALPHRRVEIGATWYTPRFQRSGVNTEAKLLLLTYAFETLNLQKVVFKTETRNVQSRAAILALGAKEEGTFARHLIADSGRMRDMVYFAIFDDMWPNVKSRLQDKLSKYSGAAPGTSPRT